MSGLSLSEVTTLRLGGPCDDVMTASTQEELIAAVVAADADHLPLLVLSGGSNVVISDDGWPGRVVLVRTRGVECRDDVIEVAAGEPWSDFVTAMVGEGRSGVEALAGIPGAVGSTPIQNVGAYGQDVSATVQSVRVWDRRLGEQAQLGAAACEFGYRDSVFKRHPGRYVVLSVTFRLPIGAAAPIRYPELARRLELIDAPSSDATIAPAAVAAAVLDLRRAKGMVLDPSDHDTWSAGSFFTNPIIALEQVPDGAPQFPGPTPELRKTSAAWLIEHAGFGKGYRVRPGAPAGLSDKHTLALTNRGSARTADLLELARDVRAGVRRAFDIELTPEPVLIGCAL